jgi:hypothetical protein
MNWLVLILAFCLAVLLGAFLARLLERSRTAWSARRRIWAAAAVLPGFIVLATIAAVAWVVSVGPGTGENMQDLAVAATVAVGVIFALVALLGGFVGASYAQRGNQG